VLLLRSEEVVDRGVVALVRSDSPPKPRVNESVGDCVMLAGPVLGTASRRMVVKVLVVASVPSFSRDKVEAHLRHGTLCTLEGIVSKMHLTTRPHIRHMFGFV
jgi:hypothetical protein